MTDATGLSIPDLPPDVDVMTAALLYADAGWYTLPIGRGSKNAGSVVGNGWPAKSSRDPKQIAAWFAGTDHDIALHCGRSGAVVFDVDHFDKVPNELSVELTGLRASVRLVFDMEAAALEGVPPYQNTRPNEDPQRGHYIFGMLPGRSIGNKGGRLGKAWGEVRGKNGIVVVAPNPDGRRWLRTGPVPTLPDELAELLDDSSHADDAASDAEVRAFLAEHTDATWPAIMRGWIKALTHHFETGSRHNGAVSVTVGALKEARAGLLNAQTVIDTLGAMFVAAATRAPTGGEKQRTQQQAIDEYRGVIAWAVGQANAADLRDVRRRVEATYVG